MCSVRSIEVVELLPLLRFLVEIDVVRVGQQLVKQTHALGAFAPDSIEI